MNVDTIFNGTNLIFVVIGAFYVLFNKAMDEKFKRVVEQLKDLKEESKADDHDVKCELRRVDQVRVDQITALHIRIDRVKDTLCEVEKRVAELQGKNN
jgi:hypothetical protein